MVIQLNVDGDFSKAFAKFKDFQTLCGLWFTSSNRRVTMIGGSKRGRVPVRSFLGKWVGIVSIWMWTAVASPSRELTKHWNRKWVRQIDKISSIYGVTRRLLWGQDKTRKPRYQWLSSMPASSQCTGGSFRPLTFLMQVLENTRVGVWKLDELLASRPDSPLGNEPMGMGGCAILPIGQWWLSKKKIKKGLLSGAQQGQWKVLFGSLHKQTKTCALSISNSETNPRSAQKIHDYDWAQLIHSL